MVTAGDVSAQALYGSLVGNVMDESGGDDPGRDGRHHAQGDEPDTEQTTPENGTYSFPNLHPGTYDVVVTLPGSRHLRPATLLCVSGPSSASTRGSGRHARRIRGGDSRGGDPAS